MPALAVAFFKALLFFGLISSHQSHGSEYDPKVHECFRYLLAKGLVDKVEPFIPWDAIANKERHEILNFTGDLEAKVFIKVEFLGTVPGEHFYQMVSLSKQLSRQKVGPKFFGTTFRAHPSGAWGLVYEFIEGSLYRPDYRRGGQTPHQSARTPDDTKITRSMIKDVNKAFDVLNSLGIRAEDPQFLLTPEGRAVLIDYGAYRQATPSARISEYNDKRRIAIITGLKAGLQR